MAGKAKAQKKGTFLDDSPFVRVGEETKQSSNLRRHLLETIETHYKATVVAFFTSFTDPDVQINDTDAEMLEGVLSAEHTDGGKVLLMINSPGGQALAAERIVNVCRAYSKDNFEVLVPHMAKSAATMICFGSSKIHMSKTAELGPVDPQVPYWKESQKKPFWLSAEEYLRSYDNLLDRASNGKAPRIEPFIQQLNRYDARYMEKLRSIQRLSEDISIRLLKSSMMSKWNEARIKLKIEPFLSQKKKSAHGRMINYSEAASCGLKIELVDLGSPAWDAIWEFYIRADWAVSQRCGKIMETSKSALVV